MSTECEYPSAPKLTIVVPKQEEVEKLEADLDALEAFFDKTVKGWRKEPITSTKLTRSELDLLRLRNNACRTRLEAMRRCLDARRPGWGLKYRKMFADEGTATLPAGGAASSELSLKEIEELEAGVDALEDDFDKFEIGWREGIITSNATPTRSELDLLSRKLACGSRVDALVRCLDERHPDWRKD